MAQAPDMAEADLIGCFLDQPVLLVAAHPDDETIGMGGTMACPPVFGLMVATDGAPRPASWRRRLVELVRTRAVARQRRSELQEALALGRRNFAFVDYCGLIDQELIDAADRLARALARRLATQRFAAVVTHPYEGGHPDHDATALAVQCACALIVRSGRPRPQVIEMTSYHRANGQMVYGQFLPQPGAGVEREIPLTEAEQAQKRAMFGCYASQARVLASFDTARERFRLAPAYDFRLPPAAGALAYETYGWGVSAAQWRASAGRVIDRLGLVCTGAGLA